MGLLNQKERIIDFVLTDKGRELLSRGLLEFVYYAFSDDGVDYNAPMETFPIEASQMKNEIGAEKGIDLAHFLFSTESSSLTAPRMVPITEESSLRRRYKSMPLSAYVKLLRSGGMPARQLGVVARTATPSLESSPTDIESTELVFGVDRNIVEPVVRDERALHSGDGFVVRVLSSDELTRIPSLELEEAVELDIDE